MKHTTLEHVYIHGIFNRKIFKLLKIVIFLAILSICFIVVHNTTKRKEGYRKSADFFIQKEDFDILFFGSSHMFTVVYPMQLWNSFL